MYMQETPVPYSATGADDFSHASRSVKTTGDDDEHRDEVPDVVTCLKFPAIFVAIGAAPFRPGSTS